MDNQLKEKIHNYCQYIITGKPVANLPIKTKYIKDVKNLIEKEYKLKIFIEPLAEGWFSLWIYKKDFMLEVVMALPHNPKTIYDHWVLGKTFGYSDEAIEEFLTTPKRSSTTTRTRG